MNIPIYLIIIVVLALLALALIVVFLFVKMNRSQPSLTNDDKKMDDEKSDDRKSDDEKSDDRKSDDRKSDDRKSDDEKSDDEKSDDRKSDDEKSDDEKSDDRKSDDRKSDDEKQKKIKDTKVELFYTTYDKLVSEQEVVNVLTGPLVSRWFKDNIKGFNAICFLAKPTKKNSKMFNIGGYRADIDKDHSMLQVVVDSKTNLPVNARMVSFSQIDSDLLALFNGQDYLVIK